MQRRVEAELLDELPADDPGAQGSRRDLRRLNAWMGNPRIMARELGLVMQERKPARVVEIGAGDGQFLLSVARRLGGNGNAIQAVLVDRQKVLLSETERRFQRLGWLVKPSSADVFDWLEQPTGQIYDAIIANLFLHHFSESQLIELLGKAASRARVFIALEPRRSAFALAMSRMIGLVGCNQVTRHDAPASVRAGFIGNELSRLWPAEKNWSLREGRAGLLSHLFVARQIR